MVRRAGAVRGHDVVMSPDEPRPNEPPLGSTALWTWIVMLTVLFMVMVLVVAVIQTHAQ